MKVTSIVQFLLVLIACSGHAVTCSLTSGNATDHLSLLDFKKSIILDPQQALMTWNESTHYCQWEGVLCMAKAPFRVISLDLSGRGLVGTISPSIGNLTLLNNLSLPNNAFSGQIPSSLGHMRHIQHLYLSKNTLQGEIPDFSNGSRLKALWLDHNGLVGQMPAYTNLPPHVEELSIGHNNLTGTIPPSIFNITTLIRLSIIFNQISGEIPGEIGKLPLQVFSSGGNKLSGRFQQNILNLSSLVLLNLASNYLNGELPSNLGSSLPNLQRFGVFNNLFSGHMPSSLANASKLFLVDMSKNSFTGLVPSSIGKLKELSWLNLEHNRFQAHDKQGWRFMYSLTNCTNLQKFSLEDNQLGGQIPSSFGNLSERLVMLYIGSNRIAGGFPSGIENLRSLSYLGLEGNQFTGAIAQGLGTLKSLQNLSLSNNMFTGNIPSSLSNLSQLGQLFLDSNQLDGKIPPTLGNLQVLEALEISTNNFHGNIPKEIFMIPTIRNIGLSSNRLDGPIPREIGNAQQLQYLYLSTNNISNAIPDTLGNCESLMDIELDHNFLNGSIPASLGNIRSLEVLNISYNQLSGSIPERISNLQFLEQLDLSFNQLDGEVPRKGIFKNATAISIDGNKGLCGGPTVLQLPICPVMPTNATAKHTRSIMLKVVIPVGSLLSFAMAVIAVLLLCRRRKRRKLLSLPSFGRKFPKVSYQDLARATNGFSTSNLIGMGRYRYSSVYRGNFLEDGSVVAVKVFSVQRSWAHKSFVAECNALRNIRHRNLVPILTACSSIDSGGNDFKALIYEFMPRGDLHKVLYSAGDSENPSNLNNITLVERLSIVVDVADALAYIHHNSQGSIVHCDMKPSNILLDENMTAHVGDFGLAKFKVDVATSSLGDSNSSASVAIRGTIGYVAPEYAGGGEVSTAADVYSFGVVLLEIFIRKRPTDDMFNDGLSIVRFAENNIPDRVLEIVDPQLRQELELSQETATADKEKGMRCLISALNIGLSCTKPSPSERISMQEVAAKLHRIKDAYIKGN